MNLRLRKSALLLFVVAIVGIGVAAQLQERPHPILAGLKVGDRIDIRWNEGSPDRVSGAARTPGRAGIGGFEVYNYNGICRIVELGPDYLVFERTSKTYAVHINHIRFVMLR